jgi:peptide-methionine (R)-S-oxide reductase
MSTRIEKPDREWKTELSPEQFHVLREHGTEPPFSGRYVHTKSDGTYCCAACGADLFSSDTKFDSGTGWPSFTEPVNQKNVELREDRSFFMRRTEVLCGTCGSHLGHVFDDGPGPTGQRWCINSLSLDLREQGAEQKPEEER